MPRANYRRRLLDGALECLRTKGYAHTTARDLIDGHLASPWIAPFWR